MISTNDTRTPINGVRHLLSAAAIGMALMVGSTAQAATPGITGTGAVQTFNLTAGPGVITQPDGMQIYSWGYGCTTPASATFAPFPGSCPLMQVPAPTLIVTEGKPVTVVLTNSLPKGAGNTSILFSGFQVTGGAGCVAGLRVPEALPGGTCTYTFTPTAPGTHSYYSGTQSDLQVEMGLYGAVVVLPANDSVAQCTNTTLHPGAIPLATLGGFNGANDDYRLAASALDHPASCYDREYLFQWAELDPNIHRQAEVQANFIATCTAPVSSGTPAATNPTNLPCPSSLDVLTEPYHPRYFMINGRSMPDNMDANYAPNYPNQPYNANPHMHPGELTLVRAVGTGRWQHPFHEHGNHVRILARDGFPILAQTNATGAACTGAACPLGGRMEFDTDTTPGQTLDGIFYWSGKGLNWDIFGHTPNVASDVVLSLTESGHTVTAATYTPNAVVSSSGPANYATIQGAPSSAYNGYLGTYPITIIPCAAPYTTGNTCFTYTATTTGLPAFTQSTSVGTFAPAVLVKQPTTVVTDSDQNPTCAPDSNGYYTAASPSPGPATRPTYTGTTMSGGNRNYYEWCADHDHPLEANPVGPVAGGGPATLPDPLVMTNGLWYNGTPYLGPDAVNRSRGPTPLPPGGALQNPPAESGIAFMWHSHNEREITTNDVFPGGMLMMMLVDPYVWYIDENL